MSDTGAVPFIYSEDGDKFKVNEEICEYLSSFEGKIGTQSNNTMIVVLC